MIAEAAAVLARGGLVAFPTETVYGLGARGLHERDVGLIFAAKGRPKGHPLILHVDGEDMACTVAATWSERASLLARTFWPGPLTLVVARASHVPDIVSGGLATVGVRAPRHPVALALIRAVGEPLAAPSANAHTHVSPTTAEHVVRSLGDRVDLVLDAGPCQHGIESTVLDIVNDRPRVLRAGATSLEAIRAVLPDVAYDAVTLTGDAARASPGMASKHYAPRTRVILAEPTAKFLANLSAVASGLSRVGAVVWSAEAKSAVGVTPEPGSSLVTLATLAALPDDPEGYAHGIFAALHDADAAALDVLVIERVPDEPAWWAVADRLRRAAET